MGAFAAARQSGVRPFERRLVGEALVRRAVARAVALGLVSAALLVAQALALAALIAGVAERSGPHLGAFGLGRVDELGVLALSFALRGGCALGAELAGVRAAEAVKADLRRRLLDPAARPAGRSTAPGELAALAGRGLDALDAYLGRCLPDLLLAGVVPLALVAVLFWLDWVSGAIALVLVTLYPIFGTLVGRSTGSIAAERLGALRRLGATIADLFAGLEVLKVFGRSAQARERLAAVGTALERASGRSLRIAFLSALVLDTLGSVSVAMIAVPLGLRLLSGALPLSVALAVLIVAPEVFVPLRRASAEFHESVEGLAAASAVFAELSGPARPARSGPPRSPRRIELREVDVGGPANGRRVLEAASLVLRLDETVALVGQNGSGKSTTLALLLGLCRPQAGEVLLDGVDLGGVDLGAWHLELAYLPERPMLLADTLAANLRLAAPEASDNELVAVLAELDEGRLLAGLASGLATLIGEGGQRLSAGERQRVGLARVLLRPARYYLLDEPTAHLDAALERQAVAALAGRLGGRGGVVVTHRAAPLRLAERVVQLAGGSFGPPSGSGDLRPVRR
ncbi:MAG: thiol reductant ABC exporter subunit CydD [Actinomycetota bacterium]|nr:thiol reductant ABC exporter subunit CydD [Actinomycetota bacterium]